MKEPFTPHGVTLFGEPVSGAHTSRLGDTFLIPPFTVLNAREGWWQERKRAWLALGIQSELGRGDNLSALGGATDRREAIRGGAKPIAAAFDVRHGLTTWQKVHK